MFIRFKRQKVAKIGHVCCNHDITNAFESSDLLLSLSLPQVYSFLMKGSNKLGNGKEETNARFFIDRIILVYALIIHIHETSDGQVR